MLFGLVLTVSLLMGGTLQAEAQQRQAAPQEIRDKAVNVIQNDYDMYCTVSSDEAMYNFLGLFVNDAAPVYNDLLGQGREQTLTAGDYARLMAGGNLRSTRVTIKNIQVDSEPRKEGNSWKVNVRFDKSISFYNRCGVYFSSREFYGSDYQLTAVVVYDNVDGKCRIERIDGTMFSESQLTPDYFVFRKMDTRDDLLSYHQQPLRFNSNNQALLNGQLDMRGFTHQRLSPQRLHPVQDDCGVVTMDYRKPKTVSDDPLMKLRLGFGIGLGEGLKFSGGNDLLEKKAAGGWNVNVEFGYQFVSEEMFKLSAFAGLGISQSSMDLGYNMDYQYNASGTADIDGDSYERHYKGLKISQKVKMTDLAIPVYLDGELAFNEVFSVYADLGVRLNMNMSKSIDVGNAHADEIYGLFENTKLNTKVKLDGDWGHDNFGTKKSLNASAGELDGVSGMAADLLAGLGLRINIPNSPLAVDLGVGYLMGLGEIIKPEKKNGIIEYTYDANGGTEKANSLTRLLDNVKRQSLRVNVGLTYKF